MVSAPMISEEQWAVIKPRFHQIYKIENKPLKETIAILKHEGFHATQRMYKAQIKKWQFQKHNSDRELLHLLRKHVQLQRAGKTRSFRIRKRPVTVYAARRHFERKNIPIDDDSLERSVPSPTPSILSVLSEEEGSDSSTHVDISQNSAIETKLSSCTTARHSNTEGDSIATLQRLWAGSNAGKCHTLPMLQMVQSKDQIKNALINVRDFCTIITSAIRARKGRNFPLDDMRTVYDGLEISFRHLQHKRHIQALERYDYAQSTYFRMFTACDPWLLTVVIQCLFDFLSQSPASAVTVSFLRYMSQVASIVSRQHPIASLINIILNYYHRTSDVIDKMFHVCADVLSEGVGRNYSVNSYIHRMRAYALDHYGRLEDAEKVLSGDIADIEEAYGAKSKENLSRILSLAGCLYHKGDFSGALSRVDQFLSLSWDHKKASSNRVLAVACYEVMKRTDSLEVGENAAVRIKMWLLQFKALAKHVAHAEELVNWLQKGAPMSG